MIRKLANRKNELLSVGNSTVKLINSAGEDSKSSSSTAKFKGKELLKVLLGVTLIIIIVLAALNIHFYNTAQILTGKIQGATLETASGFAFSLYYAAIVLRTEPVPENVRSLISYFRYYIYCGRECLRALQKYLLPSDYGDSLEIIEELLRNMTVGGMGGVCDVFDSISNVSVLIDAYKELDLKTSQKFIDMGSELVEAFEAHRYDYTVVSFNINQTRLENAISIANELKTITDEWIIKYSEYGT